MQATYMSEFRDDSSMTQIESKHCPFPVIIRFYDYCVISNLHILEIFAHIEILGYKSEFEFILNGNAFRKSKIFCISFTEMENTYENFKNCE